MEISTEGDSGKGKKNRRGEEDENGDRPGSVEAPIEASRKRKKQKKSGSIADGSSDLGEIMLKKNEEERKKKKKKDRRSEDSSPSSGRDATSEDRRDSGEGISLNLSDDKTRATSKKENSSENGEELTKKKKKKSKLKVSEDENATGEDRRDSDDKTRGKGKKENIIENGKELPKKKRKNSKLIVGEDSNAPSSRSPGGHQGSVGDDNQKRESSSGAKKSTKNREKKDRNNAKKKPAKVSDKISSKKSDAKKKRVSFSGQDEVFPPISEDGEVVRGKRFTKKEDEMVREAVLNYIKENNLGEDGLQKVLCSKSHAELRGCWKEIGAAMPWRPTVSIYYRAHNLFQRSEKRKWEPEELDLIRSYHKEHGAKWNEMAQILGKHRIHVKDAWRRSIKLDNPKRGKWTLEEYQSLFDLVNADLQLKAFEEKKTKHGMLRENISWGTISEKMTTRFEMSCCMKWYNQLTSPMVAEGLWADTDDYLLIDELLKRDACCLEDVEWDNLLEHRSGEISLRRWRQMTKHIGGAQERSFMEQVEILASRYCPNMLEYRAHTVKKSAMEGDGCEV